MSGLSFYSNVYTIVLVVLLIFICCFFIPLMETNQNFSDIDFSYSESFTLSSNSFIWPVPGYARISSKFGPRKSPTAGASSYHKGIDVPAPPGTALVAICDGIVVSSGFAGSGGFTVTYTASPYRISYCHVSPEMLVSKGQKVYAGQVIATVGPKNVYGVIGNPYKDSNGNPTNGSLTGPHLHLGIKKDDAHIDPLTLLKN